MMRRGLDIAGFQLVWLSAAFGASQNLSWPGILAATVFLIIQLWITSSRRPMILTILACGAIGFAVESALVVSGVLRYSAAWPIENLGPLWIVAIWLAFGTTLGFMRDVLGQRPLAKSAILGVVFGPLSYIAGERIGALVFVKAALPSVLILALAWGLAMPLLLFMQNRFDQQT